MSANILCQSRPLLDLIQKEWPALMADLLNTGVWSREVWQAAQSKLQVLQASALKNPSWFSSRALLGSMVIELGTVTTKPSSGQQDPSAPTIASSASASATALSPATPTATSTRASLLKRQAIPTPAPNDPVLLYLHSSVKAAHLVIKNQPLPTDLESLLTACNAGPKAPVPSLPPLTEPLNRVSYLALGCVQVPLPPPNQWLNETCLATTDMHSPQCISKAPSFNPSCYGQATFLDIAPVTAAAPSVGFVIGAAFGTLGGVLVLLAIAYFVAREKLKQRSKQFSRTCPPSAAEGYRALQSDASQSQIRSTPGNSRHGSIRGPLVNGLMPAMTPSISLNNLSNDGVNAANRPGTNPRRSSLRASREMSAESNESLARDASGPSAAAETTLTTGATVGITFANEQPAVPPRRSSASLSAFAAALRNGLRMNHSAPPSPTSNSFQRESEQIAASAMERAGNTAAGERTTSSAPMMRQTHVVFASPVDAPMQASSNVERRRSDSIALSSAVYRAQVLGQQQRRSTSPVPVQMPQPILRRPARQLPTPGDIAQPQPQYPSRSRSLTPVSRPASPAPGASSSPMPGSQLNPHVDHANTAPLPFATLAPPPMPSLPPTPSQPELINVLTPVPMELSGGSEQQHGASAHQPTAQQDQHPALPQQMVHVLDFLGPSVSVHWLTFGHPPQRTAAKAVNMSLLSNEWRSTYGIAKYDIPTHLMGWERTQARKAMGAAIVFALAQFESLMDTFPTVPGTMPHQATEVRGMVRWFNALEVAAQSLNPSWISHGKSNPFILATNSIVDAAQAVADSIWAPVMEASRVPVGRAVRSVLRAMMLIKAKVPYAAVITVSAHGNGSPAVTFNPRVMMFDSADPVPSSPDGVVHVQCELFPGLVDASRTQVMVPCMVLA